MQINCWRGKEVVIERELGPLGKEGVNPLLVEFIQVPVNWYPSFQDFESVMKGTFTKWNCKWSEHGCCFAEIL